MRQRYLSYGGDPLGPFELDQAVARVRQAPSSHAWGDKFARWLPIKQIGALIDGGCR